MCGIVGLIDFGRRRSVDSNRQIVEAMRDVMVHRGPDGAGLWSSDDGRVVLGHRRLSIIDTSSAGTQPMANEAGDVWITYNGEVYNHAELRPGLEAAGHSYHS